MTHRAICPAVRHASRVVCLLLLSLFDAAGLAVAAVAGDQVELTATPRSGVPLHRAPGGTQRFQRVPGGTVATVMGTAQEGRWLQIRLPDQRTGWIARRYWGGP